MENFGLRFAAQYFSLQELVRALAHAVVEITGVGHLLVLRDLIIAVLHIWLHTLPAVSALTKVAPAKIGLRWKFLTRLFLLDVLRGDHVFLFKGPVLIVTW